LKNFTKKLIDLYRYPKEYNLPVSIYICHRVLLKMFGQGKVNQYLTKKILGFQNFTNLLNYTNGKVLHVGACRAEESEIYQNAGLGAIFIEANPELEKDLKTQLADKNNMNYIIALVMNTKGQKVRFNIGENVEYSSSLDFSKNTVTWKKLWPDVDLKMINFIELESTTVMDLIKDKKLDIESVDHIVIDTQGTELEVLQGMPRVLLEQVSYITLEVSTIEIYNGQKLYPSVKQFLAGYGLKPMWEPVAPHADLSFKRQ
jgi:FkbM family methyltransferase